ncbi:MAG: hypothetical protein ACI83W_001993, partial [Marinoscillum sp.]
YLGMTGDFQSLPKLWRFQPIVVYFNIMYGLGIKKGLREAQTLVDFSFVTFMPQGAHCCSRISH